MSLDKDGLLSDDLHRYSAPIRQRYGALFDLLSRINRYCQASKYRIQVHNRDGREIAAVVLMIKLLSDVQAAIFLLQHALVVQGHILLRSGIEALILLRNVCIREDFYRAFIVDAERERLRMVRGIRRSESPALDEVRNAITPELIDRIKKEINEANVTDEHIETLVKSVGLDVPYQGAYRLYCQSAHSTARALEEFLVMGPDGEVKSFSWAPAHDADVNAELLLAGTLLLFAMQDVHQLFGLELEPECSFLHAEVDRPGELPSAKN